jgi:plastocyanin
MKGVALYAFLLAGGAATVWAYEEAPVSGAGRIAGRVHVAGDVPRLPPQPVYKHQAECGTTVADERLVADDSGGLRYAVVHLTEVTRGKPIPRDQPVVLDNARCAFVPHVLSATVGQTVEVRNQDPFLHDAHARLAAKTLFNVAVPKGRTVRRPLLETGLVHINCNVRHTWMHAYLFVGAHPYHTVTGPDGRFVIDDVPPGTYTLRVWHEMLGSADQQVTVSAGETSTADLSLSATAVEVP